MKKKSIILFVAFLVVCGGSVAAQPVHPVLPYYEIYGDISGFPEGTVAYLYNFEIGNIFLIDSTEIKNGKIYFRDSLLKPYQMVDLFFGDPDARIFYIRSGENHITAKKGAFGQARVLGAALEKEKATIDSLIALAPKNAEAIRSRYIDEHPGSIGSVWLLSIYCANWDKELVSRHFQHLTDAQKATPFGQNIATYLSVSKHIQIGDTAVDFTLPDIHGKAVSLSDYKGRYVLLDFWGSWCVPCIQEIPYLKKAIRQYHQKGFDILGVSVETNKTNWSNSLLKYGISWPSLSDLKGEDTKAVYGYGVSQFPANYLINPKGIVIAKDLRGIDLLVKLAELFSSE